MAETLIVVPCYNEAARLPADRFVEFAEACPDVGFVFEQDPAAALTMRQRFFPRAAEERALIAATHMPFPGLGRIVRDNGRLRWLNAEWAHQG